MSGQIPWEFRRHPANGWRCFNLHPEDASVNITRSNYDFDECSATGTFLARQMPVHQHQFEPKDSAKGEVARTLFYMAVRYEGTENGNGS